jgi:hypothetical protein
VADNILLFFYKNKRKQNKKNNKILPATSACCGTVVRNECMNHFSPSNACCTQSVLSIFFYKGVVCKMCTTNITPSLPLFCQKSKHCQGIAHSSSSLTLRCHPCLYMIDTVFASIINIYQHDFCSSFFKTISLSLSLSLSL